MKRTVFALIFLGSATTAMATTTFDAPPMGFADSFGQQQAFVPAADPWPGNMPMPPTPDPWPPISQPPDPWVPAPDPWVNMPPIEQPPDNAPVPEPGTIALMGSGLFGLLWLARRRRATQR